ncbi:unnamed protein product [Cyprideis torosa]|uniref:Uncharacterized protein n=1 Tax=Cyprideis torosa TaxID=163714 RepID=A0A7R8WQD9_9CRUS|nr:unnamed protein product [Cyprideis torosa]CAG0907916.1 unnamed protein product [Cyprideis torosa]
MTHRWRTPDPGGGGPSTHHLSPKVAILLVCVVGLTILTDAQLNLSNTLLGRIIRRLRTALNRTLSRLRLRFNLSRLRLRFNLTRLRTRLRRVFNFSRLRLRRLNFTRFRINLRSILNRTRFRLRRILNFTRLRRLFGKRRRKRSASQKDQEAMSVAAKPASKALKAAFHSFMKEKRLLEVGLL